MSLGCLWYNCRYSVLKFVYVTSHSLLVHPVVRKILERKKNEKRGSKYQNFTRKVQNCYAVSGPPYCSVVDPGEGHRDPTPPLFLNQNEAWRPKNGDPPPPLLSRGLDDRVPIPLSQGLDPALLLTPMGVACIFAICTTENRVCKNREWKIESLGQSPLVKTNSDILHPWLYGDMDYINCRAKIVDQKLQCWFRAQFASFSL